MQTTLIDLLNPDHILFHLEVKDAKTAIERLAAPLLRTNHVQPEYAADVWQRELTYPTGLPTQPFGIAIPHADADHINRSAMAIGILHKPVAFFQMGTDNDVMIDAKIIFLLAIKEKEKQVIMLQQLMTLIQSADLLEKLTTLNRGQDAIDLIKETK